MDYDRGTRSSLYPGIFHGLGTLGEPYKIHIDPDAKPYAIFSPRRVPYPLQDKVKQELSRMQTLGVISKVEDSTEWCAGIIALPKKSGGIRICVDLKLLFHNSRVLKYSLSSMLTVASGKFLSPDRLLHFSHHLGGCHLVCLVPLSCSRNVWVNCWRDWMELFA